MPRLYAALATALSLLMLPAVSHAAVVAGAADDEPGGGRNGQEDLQRTALVYDTAGSVRGAFVLAEPPTSAAVFGLRMAIGNWSKKRGWCEPGASVELYPPDSVVPEWYGGIYVGDSEGPDALITPQGTSVSFDVTAAEAAGKSWNCAWASSARPKGADDYGDADEIHAFSLTAEQAQQPTAPPTCVLQARGVRRGKKIRFKCSNVRGKLAVRIYHGNKLERTVKAKVGSGGRLTVSTRGLRRGWHAFLAWRGADVLGYGERKVR